MKQEKLSRPPCLTNLHRHLAGKWAYIGWANLLILVDFYQPLLLLVILLPQSKSWRQPDTVKADLLEGFKLLVAVGRGQW